MAETAFPARDRVLLATAMVVAAGVCYGTGPFFAKSLTDAGMPAYVVAFYRFVLTTLVFLPALGPVLRQPWLALWGLAAGALMGLGAVGYIQALEVAPVSAVSVLYMTYPAFTVLLSALWLRRRPSPRALAAAGLVVAAAFFAVAPGTVPPGALPALVLSLAAPASFAFGIVVLVEKLSALPALSRIAITAFGSAVGLMPLVASAPLEVVFPADPALWALIGGVAVITAFVPQVLFVVYAPKIGSERASMAGSVELPTMFLVGALAFSEVIGPAQWAACALILAAIALTPARATRSLPSKLASPPRA